MKHFLKYIFLSLALLLSIPAAHITVQAQSSNDYGLANTLIRQGEYERAYDILERLMRQNPANYPVYDRSMTALINLRRLDEAIDITLKRLDSRYADFNTWVKLGELYHIDRQFEKATEAWMKTIELYGTEIQVYRRVAETMNQRRDFEGAVMVYETARENFSNPTLFQQEIANTYLSAGDYERGMRENLALIATNYNFVFAVQRQLTLFDEPYLYDIAILETEDAIAENRPNQELINHYRDFLIWLQMERQLYRRAMATSRIMEREIQGRYAIYELGSRLLSRDEFELAEEAFMHYYDSRNHPHRARAMQELAALYMQWAQFKVSRNLDFDNSSRKLYQKASAVISELNEQYPNYHRKSDILAMQIELSLDYLKDLENAQHYFKQYETIARQEGLENDRGFYRGRLFLFEGDFTMARLELSRVNRAVRSGSLADQSRYYLALGDFYNKEYDFSRLQLRSLERFNTSFYANNALQLRVWIQNGVQKDDSLKTEINKFSQAHFLYSTGNYDASLALLMDFLVNHSYHPLTGEALLLASRMVRGNSVEAAFTLLAGYQQQIQMAITKERLMWEKASLADIIYRKQQGEQLTSSDVLDDGITEYAALDFTGDLTLDFEDVISHYENLLIEFPQGFYARNTRVRIQELQKTRQAS